MKPYKIFLNDLPALQKLLVGRSVVEARFDNKSWILDNGTQVELLGGKNPLKDIFFDTFFQKIEKVAVLSYPSEEAHGQLQDHTVFVHGESFGKNILEVTEESIGIVGVILKVTESEESEIDTAEEEDIVVDARTAPLLENYRKVRKAVEDTFFDVTSRYSRVSSGFVTDDKFHAEVRGAQPHELERDIDDPTKLSPYALIVEFCGETFYYSGNADIVRFFNALEKP